ncbi:MAG: hypothetical protein RMJ35_13025, partial [Phycisphaerales bacterium]|nr:hypothetical protein [Phycisphaerales bacterium]
AGLTTLSLLAEPGVFSSITRATARLVAALRDSAARHQIPVQVAQAGSMFGCYFLKHGAGTIRNYSSARQFADTSMYARFFHEMLREGVYLAPSQFEAGFLSSAHDETILQQTIAAIHHAMDRLRQTPASIAGV